MVNWFADIEHIEILAGGAITLGLNAATLWRSVVLGQRQAVLRRMVEANDGVILTELSTAQKSLDTVVAALSGGRLDRRNGIRWSQSQSSSAPTLRPT